MNDKESFEPCDATRDAVELEDQERAEANERAAEIKDPGCDPGSAARWYDGLPIKEKIRIQKTNIETARLLGYGQSVIYFQDKLAALMERQNAGPDSGAGSNASTAGLAQRTVLARD